MARKSALAEVEEHVEKISQPPEETAPHQFLSTGSTLLNLALTDRIDGGWPLGTICNLIGQSNTAKSLLAWSAMAEAVMAPRFDRYSLFYEDNEEAVFFPKEMFGNRIERVKLVPDEKLGYRTIQAWHTDLLEWTQNPLIHVTDSWDAVTSEDDLSAAGKLKKGGYRTEKPLVTSAAFPQILGQVKKHNSLLIIISQTKLSLGGLFQTQRRSGGASLQFYSSCEVWLDKSTKLKKKVRDVDRTIGRLVQARVGRSRITGKERTVYFPVLYEYGVDDTTSCVEWLTSEKFWGIKAKVVDTGGDLGFGEPVKIEKLVAMIEGQNKEQELRELVGKCWNALEDEIKLNRKPKYS